MVQTYLPITHVNFTKLMVLDLKYISS